MAAVYSVLWASTKTPVVQGMVVFRRHLSRSDERLCVVVIHGEVDTKRAMYLRRRIMNKTPLLVTIGAITLTTWSAALCMEPEPGQLACAIDEAANECRVKWNMTADPRSSYRVERFDPKQKAWFVEQEATSDYGTSDAAAKPGSLYRVVGCNGLDCVSTSVYWIPVVPSSADAIPERIRKHDGNYTSVSKGLPLRTQILQYNVYLFARDFEAIDLGEMPDMTPPPPLPATVTDMIHDNVYPNYMGYKLSALGTTPKPLPERDEARVIHPLGHSEHSHEQDNSQR